MSDLAVPLFDPPAAIEIARPFWDGIDAHEIRLSRCSACKRWQWYPDDTGPDCAGADYEWVTVATTGELHTFTRVHRQFLPGPAGPLPFVVGFVHLDGVDGPRLVAPVIDGADVAIGRRVRGRFSELGGRTRLLFDIEKGTA